MPQKKPPPPERTPAGRLEEARLRSVLGYQLVQASIVTDAIYAEQVGQPLQLRPVDYTVLTLIAENPGGSLARLARALAVTAPHVSLVVDRLEERKLIERTQSEEDRRTQVLRVTARGAALVREATEKIVAAEEAQIPLTTGERGLLIELLHKVASARRGR